MEGDEASPSHARDGASSRISDSEQASPSHARGYASDSEDASPCQGHEKERGRLRPELQGAFDVGSPFGRSCASGAASPSPRLTPRGSPRTFQEKKNSFKVSLREQRRSALIDTDPNTYSWAAYVVRLVECLRRCGGGSFLRGWRRELDPAGDLEFRYRKLQECSERIGLPGDPRIMFLARGLPSEGKRIKLGEIHMESQQLIDDFRKWMRANFRSSDKMFEAFDWDLSGALSQEEFMSGCKEASYPGTEEDMLEIYRCCDVEGSGDIGQQDMAFLNSGANRVQRVLLKKKQALTNSSRIQDSVALQKAHEEAQSLPASHRLARRPWLDEEISRTLPLVKRNEREAWLVKSQRRCVMARREFLKQAARLHGSEVRAWRAVLDPQADFKVLPTVLRQFCGKRSLKLDVASLCKGLDQDRDGYVDFSEFCPLTAADLCKLQRWARGTYGSCARLWDSAAEARIEKKGERSLCSGKMLLGVFDEFLRVAGWRSSTGRILPALDLYGCGFLQRSDLEWLDKWEVPPWFDAEPDAAAWSELRRMLLREHMHPLRAWRYFLSRDDSERICWQEFHRASKATDPELNAVGAWRYLDADASGSITLAEFDLEVATALQSFKDWSDANFGCVDAALRAIDTDGNGIVTYYELHRMCRQLEWEGSTRELFRCLVASSHGDTKELAGVSERRRTVTLKDLRFLDRWHMITNLADQDNDRDTPDDGTRPEQVPPSPSTSVGTQQASTRSKSKRTRPCTLHRSTSEPAPPTPRQPGSPKSPKSPMALQKVSSEQQMRTTLTLPRAVASVRKRRLQLCPLPPMRDSRAALDGPPSVLVGM